MGEIKELEELEELKGVIFFEGKIIFLLTNASLFYIFAAKFVQGNQNSVAHFITHQINL